MHGGMCLSTACPCVNWEFQSSINAFPIRQQWHKSPFIAHEVLIHSTVCLKPTPALATVLWEKVKECGCCWCPDPDDHATPTEVSPGQPRLLAALPPEPPVTDHKSSTSRGLRHLSQAKIKDQRSYLPICSGTSMDPIRPGNFLNLPRAVIDDTGQQVAPSRCF
jgi:hypothetical protein